MMPGTSAPGSASAAVSSPIPFKPVSQQDAIALGGSWLATVLLLGVAAAAAVLLRRRLGRQWRASSGERLVTVVETRRLGERTSLSVVRYRDRELLIAHGDQPVTVVAEHLPSTAAQAQA